MSNLKLNSLGKALNMTADNKKQLVFGNYRGYNMYIKVSDYSYCFNYSIHIPLSPENPENLGNIITSLETLRSENPGITKASYENNKLIVNTLSSDKKVNSYQFILSILNKVVEYVNTNNLVKCCENCGNHDSLAQLEFVTTNNTISLRCTSCKGGTLPITKNTQDKSNIPLGIVGSLVGSLPGFIIWILLFKLNGIPIGLAAIVSGITVLGIIKGYEFLGKILDANGKMICFLLSIIVLPAAEYIRELLYFNSEMGMGFSEIMRFIKFSDILDGEMIVIYVLSIAGALFIQYKFSSYRLR